MCGIAGLVTTGESPGRRARVQAMLEALQRRGPDGAGTWGSGPAVLGHRRLAILDLSERGRQPMTSADGAATVVFNGAIYNFLELRRELERSGRTFRSTTDTEVLVHGYLEWGIDELVRRLRGMFAFALWDDRTDELFLVRDRLGIKPLVYAGEGAGIAFASTPRALRAAGFGGDVDPQAVVEFLQWGFVPEQLCIHSGIEKLPPATILRWRNGETRTTTYWQPPAAGSLSISFDEAVEETERLLIAAVARRTRADVPIGALLSGGIDSALVCWALRESGTAVNAFAFAATNQPQDESEDARATARELGIPLEVLELNDAGDELEALFDAYAEPFACGSALGMLRLSESVREVATVLLTGDGGDDVFLGYPRHRFLLVAQQLARGIPSALAAAWLRRESPPVKGAGRSARHFIGYATGGLAAFLRVRPEFRYFQESRRLGPRLSQQRPSSWAEPVVAGAGRTVLDDYLEYDRRHQFVAEYMTKVDGATMHHGLEARSPFLDQELWEFAAALPYEIRLKGGTLKAVLREIARRRISDRVAKGPKRGFEVPIGQWMRGRGTAAVRETLESGTLRQEGLLETRDLWHALQAGSAPEMPVWYAAVLANWVERHRDARWVRIEPAGAQAGGDRAGS